MRQEEFFDMGSVSHLKEILEKEKTGKVFLVTGQASYEKSGASALLSPFLAPFEVLRFSDFQENPDIKGIQKGIDAFRSFSPDIVLAVGGGSALDTAKSVNVLACQEGAALDFVLKKKEIVNQGKPLVAVPTTAGTGAEATRFAVVYVDKTKYSLQHDFVLPRYAVIDPQLSFSLPPRITAQTGMDALAQAIESYWSNRSTEESKNYAREAVALVFKNLAAAVQNPTKESRVAMAKGAHLSGKAINISQTTACHAISYPITSYFGVPHGHAVALTLPAMFLFNSEVDEKTINDSRGVEYVRGIMEELCSLLGVQDARGVKAKLERLMDDIGLERRLSQLGAGSPESYELIVEHGFNPERVKNNPRLLIQEALRSILEQIR